MKHQARYQFKALSLAMAGSALLSLGGCGGSGGSAATAEPEITLSGVAATGAAISGGAVSFKCASGTGSATTAANGSFTGRVTNGAFPCLAKVLATDGTTLHSVVTGTGTNATANITPVTQLIVAGLAGSDPAAYFTAFDATAAKAVTSETIATAQATVVSTLKSAGVDLSALGDLITGTLTPAAAGVAGNDYDKALDALKDKLASSGTTLAALVTAVINTPAAGAPPKAGVSLPPDLLLKAAAADCSALRSTKYTMVTPFTGPTLADRLGFVVVDTAAMRFTNKFGDVIPLTPNGTCRYKYKSGPANPNMDSDLFVAQSGVFVARFTNDNGATYEFALGFPEQTHTLAELTGTWNSIGLDRNGANNAYTATTITFTLDAAATTSGSVTYCKNDTTWGLAGADCSSVTSPAAARVSSAGGFEVYNTTTNAILGRSFLYQSGSGDLMSVRVDGNGAFQIRSKQRALVLPAAGSGLTNWGPLITNSLLATNSAINANQIVAGSAVDATTYNRTSKIVGNAKGNHSETVVINSARNGYFTRPTVTAANENGTTETYPELNGLFMAGMGLYPIVVPSSKVMFLGVGQP